MAIYNLLIPGFLALSFLFTQAPAFNFKHLKHVTAMYIFGDSLIDSGNNNYLPGGSVATHLPYGIDFEGGKPTGRSTNGKTVVDFIADILGLALAPPYLGLSKSERIITTGINYASGGSGILTETNKMFCLPFETQISDFQKTVTVDLPHVLKKKREVHKHLSKSLIFVSTGINDYQVNINKAIPDPRAFAHYLLGEFSLRIQRLYDLGARRFLVNNIPPAGCLPIYVFKAKAMGSCNETMNKAITLYNNELPNLLHKLQNQLHHSVFVHSDYYRFLLELRAQGKKYGIVETWKPCCPNTIEESIDCKPFTVPCKNRDSHLFFDEHPSQIANKIYSRRCFFGRTVCTRV